MPGQGEQAAEVLNVWLVQSQPRQWFAKDPAFDRLLPQRFLGLTRRAIAGVLDAWSAEATAGLALVLLLDQFPRQIWRDTAMAFSGDPCTADFARRHRDVVARFGRFPHRNAALGRASRAEVLAFRQTPGSRF
jgi:uncharacterized protein (DUF924 family)